MRVAHCVLLPLHIISVAQERDRRGGWCRFSLHSVASPILTLAQTTNCVGGTVFAPGVVGANNTKNARANPAGSRLLVESARALRETTMQKRSGGVIAFELAFAILAALAVPIMTVAGIMRLVRALFFE